MAGWHAPFSPPGLIAGNPRFLGVATQACRRRGSHEIPYAGITRPQPVT